MSTKDTSHKYIRPEKWPKIFSSFNATIDIYNITRYNIYSVDLDMFLLVK